MPKGLQVTLRERRFYFAWCDLTEIDYVCLRCGAIVPDQQRCRHCELADQKKRERLQQFLEMKAQEN